MYVLRWPEGDLAAISETVQFEEIVADNAQEIIDFLATDPPTNPMGFRGTWVISRCTNSQMRAALRQMNLIGQVNGYIHQQSNNPYMIDRWEYANEFYYDHELVDQVVTALQLNKRALFILASTL